MGALAVVFSAFVSPETDFRPPESRCEGGTRIHVTKTPNEECLYCKLWFESMTKANLPGGQLQFQFSSSGNL